MSELVATRVREAATRLGLAHLATAYARPSVVLFGPVPPAEWGPPQHPRHQALWAGGCPVALRGDDHRPRAVAAGQRARVAAARAKRDQKQVNRALGELETAARDPRGPVMEPILAAVRARATLGEISDILRKLWGVYGATS